jgi:hypothetical protein
MLAQIKFGTSGRRAVMSKEFWLAGVEACRSVITFPRKMGSFLACCAANWWRGGESQRASN